MPDPPYEEISDLLRRGEVVPFLGAGVNLGARPEGTDWNEKSSNFLPSGSELSRLLARVSNYPSESDHEIRDLAKVSSYYVETSARRRLRERLRGVFDRDCEPCSIHKYLAGIRSPLLIVTTNYDDLTERAFAAANHPYDLVVHPSDRKDIKASIFRWRHETDVPEVVPPNQLHIDLSTTTVIYKMHGSVNRLKGKWDSYLITEDDYVDFLSLMTVQAAVPALFMRYFHSRQFLFLGYGLRDWNLRVVMKNLRGMLPPADDTASNEESDEELHSWAIQHRPAELEKVLWNARRVNVYDLKVDEFVRRLREHESRST
jgi:hypothetical protein